MEKSEGKNLSFLIMLEVKRMLGFHPLQKGMPLPPEDISPVIPNLIQHTHPSSPFLKRDYIDFCNQFIKDFYNATDRTRAEKDKVIKEDTLTPEKFYDCIFQFCAGYLAYGQCLKEEGKKDYTNRLKNVSFNTMGYIPGKDKRFAVAGVSSADGSLSITPALFLVYQFKEPLSPYDVFYDGKISTMLFNGKISTFITGLEEAAHVQQYHTGSLVKHKGSYETNPSEIAAKREVAEILGKIINAPDGPRL